MDTWIEDIENVIKFTFWNYLSSEIQRDGLNCSCANMVGLDCLRMPMNAKYHSKTTLMFGCCSLGTWPGCACWCVCVKFTRLMNDIKGWHCFSSPYALSVEIPLGDIRTAATNGLSCHQLSKWGHTCHGSVLTGTSVYVCVCVYVCMSV